VSCSRGPGGLSQQPRGMLPSRRPLTHPCLRSLSRMLLGVSGSSSSHRLRRRRVLTPREARASDGACHAEQPTPIRAIWRRGGVGAAVLQASS
jgi:hypothetical protein